MDLRGLGVEAAGPTAGVAAAPLATRAKTARIIEKVGFILSRVVGCARDRSFDGLDGGEEADLGGNEAAFMRLIV